MVFRRKRHRRGGGHRFFRRRHHRSGSGTNLMGVLLGGVGYGVAREYLANLTAPLSSKIPIAGYGESIVLGGIGYFAAKGKLPIIGSAPIVKTIGTAMLYTEAFRIGQGITSGLNLGTGGW